MYLITKELEDFYLPYKKKKKTKADVARENGLEPLAKIIMSQKNDDIEFLASNYLNTNVKNEDDEGDEEHDEGVRQFVLNEPHHKGKGGRREREEYKIFKKSEKQAQKRHKAKRKLRKKTKIGVEL